MAGMMLRRAHRLAAAVLGWDETLPVVWHRRPAGSWLAQNIPAHDLAVGRPARMPEIELVAKRLQHSGPQPLWDGYREVYARDGAVPLADARAVRTSNEVRSEASMGCFFTWLVERRQPDLVVEFGTAFGVSAMYWAAGLDRNGHGILLTFEPNATWHAIARQHLQSFSFRVIPVAGTFEANIDTHRKGQTIDIAFVDAIHTSEFVDAQVRIVMDRLSPGGLIVLDDINFSDDMRACWNRWADDPQVAASLALNERVGVLEMRGARPA